LVTGSANYQVNGLSVLDAFLEHESDERVRQAVLEFLIELRADPKPRQGFRRVGRAPLWAAMVPGTDVAVVYLLSEQFRTVLLKNIERVPPSGT
jgi:hypothetical protein